MTDAKNKDFRLSDDGTGEQLYQQELNDVRMEKLSQRVTLISVLIPVLIIVIVVVSYLDIKRKIVTAQITGTTGVESLSADLESKFSALSLQYAKLEETLSNKVETLTQENNRLHDRVKKVENANKWLSSSRVSEKKLNEVLAEKDRQVQAQLAEMEKNIQVMDQNLSELDKTVKKQLEELLALIGKSESRLIDLEAQVAIFTSDMVDRDTMENRVGHLEQTLHKEITAAVDRLEKKIDRIKRQAALPSPAVTKPPPVAASAPDTGKGDEKPAATPSANPPAPEPLAPGEIIEKPLQ